MKILWWIGQYKKIDGWGLCAPNHLFIIQHNKPSIQIHNIVIKLRLSYIVGSVDILNDLSCALYDDCVGANR